MGDGACVCVFNDGVSRLYNVNNKKPQTVVMFFEKCIGSSRERDLWYTDTKASLGWRPTSVKK